ncbi:MAG: hypothetical protein PVI55_14825 [Desulfobacterales bacterium]|jgi:hypothetical protein
MKKINHNASGFFLILFLTFFIISCASEPVKVDFPPNHPANPGAQEVEFIPPPNPFQENVTAMKGESTPDSMMNHETQGESNRKHMNHNTGNKNESEPDSDSTKKSGHVEDDNQHKEHSQ